MYLPGMTQQPQKKRLGYPGSTVPHKPQMAGGMVTGMAHTPQPTRPFGIPNAPTPNRNALATNQPNGGDSLFGIKGTAAIPLPKTAPAGQVDLLNGDNSVQKPPTPVVAPATTQGFSYNPETDPAYLARKKMIEAGVKTGTNNAMVSLGSRGIGNSQSAVVAANQMERKGLDELQNSVIPQLEGQAYQRYRDDINQQNQEKQFDLQVGQTTGYYQNDEMQGLYDQVNQAKQAYAAAKTPAERAAAHTAAEQARAKLAGMNADSSLVGSDVTLDQARANQSKYGVETMAHQQQAYNQSADNPANQAQIISNKIDQLKLNNLPETMKLELEQLKQQVATGKIDAKTAEYNFKELTDPNSITNKRKKLELQLTQMDVSNTSTQNALEVQKLKKTIENIGKTPPKSDYEAKMNDIKLETAQVKLDQLKEGKPDGGGSSKDTLEQDYNDTYAGAVADPGKAYTRLTNPAIAKDFIAKFGPDKYNKLLKAVTPVTP